MSLTTQAKALSVSVSADHEHERALDNYRLSDSCFRMLIKIKKTDLKNSSTMLTTTCYTSRSGRHVFVVCYDSGLVG